MNIVYTAVIIVTIILLSVLIYSRKISKIIKELNDASRRIAQGDFDVRVFLKNKGELKKLADNFNYMIERMRALFKELSRQKEELNSIISSIEGGICVLNEEGKIMVDNESFKRIVQNDSVKGRYYWEVLRALKFDELIKNVRNERRNLTEEIELDERVYLCNASLCFKDEIVITIHDITRIKNLEKTKKDFVANVSHELRTPLTAIKGFVETLEEDIEDKNKQYINIIKRHTDRVINIVDDLLLLSKLEEKETKLELEEVNLKALIENVLKVFDQSLKEKNLDLELKTDEILPLIKADSFKLEQVFINLIDNAIKYTERGGIKIYLNQLDNTLTIKIQDTGIGIPSEHLSRIFERFYVIDKYRSKRLGGTGLGLSIVKHVVLLHNGSIDVENIPGSGTRFTITLPINLS